MKRMLAAATAALVSASLAAPAVAAPAPPPFATVTMTIDDEPFVPALAESLGCLSRARITLKVIDILKLVPDDFRMQVPMNDGRVEVAYHWFNHTVFGARHKLPVVAVMNFNDAPGMTVFVADAQRDAIRGPADFRGKRLATGARYGTKTIISYTMAARAGLAQGDYTQVATEEKGRQQAIESGLKAGTIDVVTSEEPFTTAYRATGKVTPLYSLLDRASTEKVLGYGYPSQSLLMAPAFLTARPQVAQRVVDAFVCAMRFVNGHDAAGIVARLPASYMAGKDKAAVTADVAKALPSFAKIDYRIRAADATLVTRAIEAFRFDDSGEGRWRQYSIAGKVDPATLFDNRMVEKAMARIR